MSQSVKNRIILARSSVENKSPSADQMMYGELFINYNDGLLFYKTSNGAVKTFSSTELSAKILESFIENNTSSIFSIMGTQTSETSSWTGTCSAISSLYDGLAILFWLPLNSTSSPVTLSLTTSANDSTAYPCFWDEDTRLTTQYARGTAINLMFRQEPVINGVKKTTGWYVVSRYTDTDTTYEPLDTADLLGVDGVGGLDF